MTTLDDALAGLPDYDPNHMTVELARAIIVRTVRPVSAVEHVAVRSALGRVLGSDVISPLDVPAFENAAMDGYAFAGSALAAGGDVRLRVAGRSLAGRPFDGVAGTGECVRIMTGALMPAGCDTVVPQEQVRREGDTEIVIFAANAVTPGRHVRHVGEDLAAGHPALHAGKRLRPAALGLLASLGIAEVPVRRRIRVAFFSTGDELRSVGESLAPGNLYDSNRYTLYGMLQRLGVEVLDLGVVADDPQAIEDTLRMACRDADAVITSGGVSVGEADFTREMMTRLGNVVFWKMAMRPGRPFAFGELECDGHRALLFGLPGNPAAVMASFYHLVRDGLFALMGAEPQTTPRLPVPTATAIAKRPGRTEFLRGILATDEQGRWQVTVADAQSAGILRTMSEANCFVTLDTARGDVAAGELVDVIVFDGLV
ncbi:gephyrin-like molybdotransferase Glp [Pandoraea pulmonicola]|uniref:Molybdopterin molybdenumtransferase n=1 Tax=Pandoraea pulmonicola TaxID=93221 RepID=A0AAJ4ZEN3_PANPU|nr:gephyrin-like molybdotransferase Glp [Pandoraea pulmonicola]AJC19893.1 molybdopterin molybdenumtransferase MoeA [Pandoraea pulmonicola]SUA91908.1 Molybdopterin molybdenumtransferase [Pandoraea pulmonicola]